VYVGTKAATRPENVVMPSDEQGGDTDQRNAEMEAADTSTAAQMEWDPQTDVASPMLPLPGAAWMSVVNKTWQSIFHYNFGCA